MDKNQACSIQEPKTNAQRSKDYRARKKALQMETSSNKQIKIAKTGAERQREYIARKRALSCRSNVTLKEKIEPDLPDSTFRIENTENNSKKKVKTSTERTRECRARKRASQIAEVSKRKLIKLNDAVQPHTQEIFTQPQVLSHYIVNNVHENYNVPTASNQGDIHGHFFIDVVVNNNQDQATQHEMAQQLFVHKNTQRVMPVLIKLNDAVQPHTQEIFTEPQVLPHYIVNNAHENYNVPTASNQRDIHGDFFIDVVHNNEDQATQHEMAQQLFVHENTERVMPATGYIYNISQLFAESNDLAYQDYKQLYSQGTNADNPETGSQDSNVHFSQVEALIIASSKSVITRCGRQFKIPK